MKYALGILPAAETEVDSSALFIAKNNLDAALRFYDAVDKTYRLIRERPLRWPRYELDHPRLLNLRKRTVCGAFGKYIVYYHVTGNLIEII